MKGHDSFPRRSAFTILEVIVVIGIIAILASLLFPALFAHLEGARINETKAQLRILEGALSQYQREFGDYPPSSGAGDNAGIETMLACLRTTERGGPFVREHVIERWLADTDGDGRQELVDPWKTPWIYFHPMHYTAGAVHCRSEEKRFEVEPVKKGDSFLNLTHYQLWACGQNKTSESGQGDDVGNLVQ